MKIGYFFNGLLYRGGTLPHTEVTVRPLDNLPGFGPCITITIPALPSDATAPEIAAAALAQAQLLVPESAFAEWAMDYSRQAKEAPPPAPLTLPPDAPELLDKARFGLVTPTPD